MNLDNRARRAIRLATAAGYWAASIGCALGIVHRTDFGHTLPQEALTVLLATCSGFVLWFALVGAFAYTFPPSTDELTTKTDFPGAGKVVWPLIALLTAATIYIVFAWR